MTVDMPPTNNRKRSNRFIYDYEYYEGENLEKSKMLYLRIFPDGPAQIQLWLNPNDRKKLKEILEEENEK